MSVTNTSQSSHTESQTRPLTLKRMKLHGPGQSHPATYATTMNPTESQTLGSFKPEQTPQSSHTRSHTAPQWIHYRSSLPQTLLKAIAVKHADYHNSC